jgi:hypothetical protein
MNIQLGYLSLGLRKYIVKGDLGVNNIEIVIKVKVINKSALSNCVYATNKKEYCIF